MNEGPKWEYRKRLEIHNRMENVVKLALEAAKSERDSLLKKLRKMQYGS